MLGKKKKICFIAGGVLLVCAILLCAFFLLRQEGMTWGDTPTLTVESPQKLRLSDSDTFVLDVSISSLGDALYPAMSMSIAFDSARLEFLGIEEGNVLVHSDSNSTGQTLPEWIYNTAACNQSGCINVMYLDMTGGKNAFSQELLGEGENVLLRLKFRLRGSVRAGDVCDLIVEDAVFAASDERQSFAMTTKTLNVKNGKLVIVE